jgi:hypothetical protein
MTEEKSTKTSVMVKRINIRAAPAGLFQRAKRLFIRAVKNGVPSGLRKPAPVDPKDISPEALVGWAKKPNFSSLSEGLIVALNSTS